MLLSKCAACNNTKSKFIKEQEASGLLNKETFKKTFSRSSFVLEVLTSSQVNVMYKTNKTVNKVFLPGDKFMPEMHLRQPGFTFSACRPLAKYKGRIQKLQETGDL